MVYFFEVFRERLKNARTKAGLTQGQAADRAGVGQTYVSNLENGHSEPGVLTTVSALAQAYGTSVDYLLGLTDDPAPISVRQDLASPPELEAGAYRDMMAMVLEIAHKMGALEPLLDELDRRMPTSSGYWRALARSLFLTPPN